MNKQNILAVLVAIVIILGGFWYLQLDNKAIIQKEDIVHNSESAGDLKGQGSDNYSLAEYWTDTRIKNYISENIDTFNPVEGMLGGGMYIRDISLLAGNKFEVYQEDGHVINFFSGEYVFNKDKLEIFNIENLGEDYFDIFVRNSPDRICCETIIPDRNPKYDFSLKTECSIRRSDYMQSIVLDRYCGNDSGDFTEINVPQFSNNGEVEMTTYQVPYTQAVLNATLNKLFEIESNANGYNGLTFEAASLDFGVVSIKLSGSWYPSGDLSGVYMRRLINGAVFQFGTVDISEVYINNERFDWCIDSKADFSESGCDTAPQYWIDSRQDYLDLENIFSGT